ncbi:MAG: hypothetical protein NT015_00015 [Alphaproteobacteria bacterium]|nr:hypothetical protein [Alphaproteobacteria bacterium]
MDGALNAGTSYARVGQATGLTKRQIELHAKHKGASRRGWAFVAGSCVACGQPVDEKTAYRVQDKLKDGSAATAFAHRYPTCVAPADAKLATRAFENQFVEGRGRSPRSEWQEISDKRHREIELGERTPSKGGFTITSARDDERQPKDVDGHEGLLDDGERMDKVLAYCRETQGPLWAADLTDTREKMLSEAARKSPEQMALTLEATAQPRKRTRRPKPR